MSVAQGCSVELWGFVDEKKNLVRVPVKVGPLTVMSVPLTFENVDGAADWLDERYHYGEDGARYAQTLTMVRFIGGL